MAKSKTYTVKLSKEASRKRRELMRSNVMLDNGFFQIVDVSMLDRHIVKTLSRYAAEIISSVYEDASKKPEVSQ